MLGFYSSFCSLSLSLYKTQYTHVGLNTNTLVNGFISMEIIPLCVEMELFIRKVSARQSVSEMLSIIIEQQHICLIMKIFAYFQHLF